MAENNFTWVKTHGELVKIIRQNRDHQTRLIQALKNVGITGLHDENDNRKRFELKEIDPFSFFCYIYKYGGTRRLKYLQEISEAFKISIPTDDSGIPSVNALKVCLFPFEFRRKNNEINRLWEIFESALSDTITDEQFQDILQIHSTGKTKLTEGLFNVAPDKFFPINGPTKPYIKEVLGIDPKFDTYSEYRDILNQIRQKTHLPFFELSYEAWKWNDERKKMKDKKSQGNSQKNYREEFTEWLMQKYGENSGTTSSYVKAMDILSKILSKELFKTTEDNYLATLYQDLIKEQRNQDGKYYHSDAPSYGSNGFYSASIKSFREFLKTIDKTNSSIKDHQMNFPLNTILYGPPGTGKTYTTVLRASEIIENRKIESYAEALEIFNANLHDQIEFITFHQNYSYEDFIQGLRPDTENDKELTFERKDGVFKVIADKALKNILESEQPPVAKKSFENIFNEFISPLVEGDVEEIEVKMKKVSFFITAVTNKSIEFRKTSGGTEHTLSISTLRKMYEAESVLEIQGLSSYYSPLLGELLKRGKDASGKKEIVERKNYVIIIDEINRANISRVFGELITLIEPDKRSHGNIPMEAKLPSGDVFVVPSNLYIIGTMNTADKSIALLDIALRRRFEFESMYPKYQLDGEEVYDVEILEKINEQIIKSKGYDFQIGHAYFMGENRDLVKRMNKKVIPLLLEYYMNDEKEVKGILQSAGLTIEDKSWPIRIMDNND